MCKRAVGIQLPSGMESRTSTQACLSNGTERNSRSNAASTHSGYDRLPSNYQASSRAGYQRPMERLPIEGSAGALAIRSLPTRAVSNCVANRLTINTIGLQPIGVVTPLRKLSRLVKPGSDQLVHNCPLKSSGSGCRLSPDMPPICRRSTAEPLTERVRHSFPSCGLCLRNY